MSSKKNLRVNIIYQILYQMLLILLPLITSPYISRVLGAEGIGVYAYTYSIVNYFIIFAKLGIDNYGSREVAKVRDNKEKLNQTFSSIFYMHLIVSIIITMFYFYYIIRFSNQYFIYSLIQAIYMIAVIFDINWLFFGLEEFKVTVIRNACVKLITVISIFIFVNDVNDIWKYVLILALGNLISQSIVWIFIKRHIVFTKFNWNDVKKNFRPMLILFIPSVAVSIYKIMDKIMLGYIAGNIQVGYYENAEKMLSTCIAVIIAFGNVMLPRLTNLTVKGDKYKTQKYINISMQVIMFLSIAMAFGLAAISDKFAVIFFGDSFEVCGILILGLSITIPFMAFANVLRTQYLMPNSYDKAYLISVVAGAIINMVFNMIFIPKLGALGTVIGTVSAEISVCVIQTLFIYKFLPINIYIRESGIFMTIGMIMFMIVKFIGINMGIKVSTLIIQIVVGVSLYLVLNILYITIIKKQPFQNQLFKFIRKKFRDNI